LKHHDIAIVGAGPAGCWAAVLLARQGARVALVDASHPREKPCGGAVTGRALAIVRDVIDPALVATVSIESAIFEYGRRRARVDITVGETTSTRLGIVSRRTFDGALLSAALGAGARVIAARATDVRRAGSGWVVSARSGNVEAGWLLGADGPNSLVRRRLARPFDRADLSIATGYYVHGITARDITIAFEDHPPGYLWSFPRPDHLAVGVCAQADVSSPGMLLPLAKQWIQQRTQTGDAALERYSWPIPSLGATALQAERPAGAGWMLLGDAGGMVDPITREGIYFALSSAEAAAKSLLEADPARRYEERTRDVIYAELIRAARMKARFFRPHFSARLLRALEGSARIRAVMADLIAGQQSYRGLKRRLLGTMEFQLMLELALSNA
jgi:geranylgeranyl reductase family protein